MSLQWEPIEALELYRTIACLTLVIRCAFESLRQTKYLMSQIIHSYLKLEMALFSLLTNVEFSLLLSLPLPTKFGQTLKPSRGLAEWSCLLPTPAHHPPSPSLLGFWLGSLVCVDCVPQLPNPLSSGWGWPMGAPAGDQRETGEGGQGIHCYDSSVQVCHSGRQPPHNSLLPGSRNLSLPHPIRSGGGNSSTAWLPRTCPYLIRNKETLL